MTAEGRLARGKENYDSGKFLDNQETIDYVATLPKKKPKEDYPEENINLPPEERKPKEVKKDAKPTK